MNPELYTLLPPDKQVEYKKIYTGPVPSSSEAWSSDNANPLQDLLDWVERVDYDPLTNDNVGIIELESIIKAQFEKRERPSWNGSCFKCANFKVKIKQEGEYRRVYCAHCGELLLESGIPDNMIIMNHLTLPSIDNSIPEGYVMVGETLIKLYDEEFYKNSYADIKKEIKPKDLGKMSSLDI